MDARKFGRKVAVSVVRAWVNAVCRLLYRRKFNGTCRACGAPVVIDGSVFYIVGDRGRLVESEHCRCGEWLRWEFMEGAGGPLAWFGEVRG